MAGQFQTPSVPYPFHGLAQANLSFNNGGRGIQVSLSANVIVANNTCYNNNLDTQNSGTWRGELHSQVANNIHWINNIGWAVPVPSNHVRKYNTAMFQGTYLSTPDTNVLWRTNITYNGTPGNPSLNFNEPNQSSAKLAQAFEAVNKAGVNPTLADPQQANFRPGPGSPAIRTGTPTRFFPPISLTGYPMGFPPDIGAY